MRGRVKYLSALAILIIMFVSVLSISQLASATSGYFFNGGYKTISNKGAALTIETQNPSSTTSSFPSMISQSADNFFSSSDNESIIPKSAVLPGLLSIYMVNEKVGWALGKNFILRTVDGGQTWSDITPPGASKTSLEVAGEFLDVEAAWVAVINDREPTLTVYRTINGGQSWHEVEVIPKTRSGRIYEASLSFSDRKHGWLMVGLEHGMSSRPGELYQTTDGGEHWRLVAKNSAIGPSSEHTLPFYGLICFRDALTGWIMGRHGAAFDPDYPIYMTQDGGHTWRPQELPLPPGFANRKLAVMGPPKFFPPSGLDGVLPVVFVPVCHKTDEYTMLPYTTSDGGRTWQAGKPLQSLGLMDFISASDGWAWVSKARNYGLTNQIKGKFYHTVDGGKTWTDINMDTASDRLFKKLFEMGYDIIDLNFVTNSTGWILLRESDIKKQLDERSTILLRTVDRGDTWTILSLDNPNKLK